VRWTGYGHREVMRTCSQHAIVLTALIVVFLLVVGHRCSPSQRSASSS